MDLRKLEDAVPLIGATLGGITIGVFMRNGFLNWSGETLIAGLLGLGGGWLAYKAAIDGRKATERRNAFIFKVKHLKQIDYAGHVFELFSDADFDGKKDAFDRDLVEHAIKTLSTALTFPEPLPLTISEKIATCSDWLATFELFFEDFYDLEKADTTDSNMPPDVFTLWNIAGNLSDIARDLNQTVGEYAAHR